MEKFQKISSKVVIVLALVWAVLTFTHMIPVKISYMVIGGLAAYIGIQNIILLLLMMIICVLKNPLNSLNWQNHHKSQNYRQQTIMYL